MKVTSDLALYVLLTAAVVGDFRHMKISNRLIFTGLFTALIFRFAEGGFVQIVRVLPNIFFPVVLLFLFYLGGILGAGDIKLFSVIGGFITFRQLCACMALSFVFAAGISLLCMVKRGRFFSGLWDGMAWCLSIFQGNLYPYPQKTEANRMHFAAAVMAGMLGVHICGLLQWI